MKYDDASWHSGGEFPKESPEEYGGTHIALFLKYCFLQGWAGDLHFEQAPDDVEKVKAGTMRAIDFLFQHCDGKLTDEDLTDAGNEFASRYYGEDGLYLQDYASNFSDLMYRAPEEAHDFSRFQSIVDGRRRTGVLTESDGMTSGKPSVAAQQKPWWRFW